MTSIAAIVLTVVFVVLLVIGVPIAIAIGVSSITALLVLLPIDIAISIGAQKIFSGLDSFALLAIAFFVLAGNIMNKGGIAIRLINFAKLFTGRLPGSLLHTNVVANMLFGALSGSSVAAAAAIGGVMGPVQEKEGYKKSVSAAYNIASAPTGILIPPSGPLIIYSLVSGGTSVAALFLAGYIPGILMGLGIMLVGVIVSVKQKYPVANCVGMSEKIKIFLAGIPSLFMIVVVMGGIVAGIFTPTEAGAGAALYSLVLAIIYRTIQVKDFMRILRDSMVTTSMILFLIGASKIMSYVMSYSGIPEIVGNVLLSISNNKYVIFLLMNIVLLFVGTFMDITPAVLIFTPIFLPIAESFGMNPIHFGIMLIFNMGIGNITPPVGSVLFVGCSVAKTNIESVVKPLIPLFLVMVAMLMVVTYSAKLILWLPTLAGYIY